MGRGGYLVVIWLVYGLGSLSLTFLLARTLFRNGTVFLRALFSGNLELARAVNALLVAGFCMLSLGYSALLLGSEAIGRVHSGSDVVGLLVNRLGVLLVSLSIIHFVTMALFYRLGNRGRFAPSVAAHVSTRGLGAMEAREDVPA